MLGKAQRVLGFFVLMVGAGLALESGARRLGLALAVVGTAVFARGLWLARPGAPANQPTPPATSDGRS